MAREEDTAHIRIVVEQVRVEGKGAIILTGPSSCGKGEIAKSMCSFLSLPKELHVSMGDVLRQTVKAARANGPFRQVLSKEYHISDRISIFDPAHNGPETIGKARRYQAEIMPCITPSINEASQLDWLAFCLERGLLIPDDWAEQIIDAHFSTAPYLRDRIFILDGYPRTIAAAERLLKAFAQQGIGIIKVLHLSITKEQMKARAQNRSRGDDTDKALESRYQFYLERVQPSIDYLKTRLPPHKIALIDAHQPVFNPDGSLNLEQSIRAVTISVVEALGLPQYLLDLEQT